MLVSDGRPPAEHIGEDEPIDDDQAQRLENGPDDAEGRTGKTGVEVSPDELPEEVKIPGRGGLRA